MYSKHQKEEAARVAMELKRGLYQPTPRRVRQRLPQASRNRITNRPMSDSSVIRIFQTKCYDEGEDDPWQYLPCLAQDVLPAEVKPLRVGAAKHILANSTARSWHSHVAIDPCYTLLPKTQERLEEQRVAAMGKMRWRSKGAGRIGPNLPAPKTAKSQGPGYHSSRVDWTPVFARGKILLYVVDADAAGDNPDLPAKLTDSKNLAKFVSNVLPGLLQTMQRRYGWSDLPRTVVHDKGSYMVSPFHNRLQADFAAGLNAGGFRSWVGNDGDSAKWLVKKFGDVYIHETAIAHVRRLLDNDFCHSDLHESPAHFKRRMQKVEDHMNSPAFAAADGGGLPSLAKDLRERCELLIELKGERLPK